MAEASVTGATTPTPSAAKMYDAFLSYSSVDRSVVGRIQRFLEGYKSKSSERLSVFLDLTDVRGGALDPEIEAALSASKLLIVCCSRNAVDSRWVNTEVLAYRRLHEQPKIALILLDGEAKDTVPLAARDLELRYHDLRHGWVLGVLRPFARDELLRLLALITGAGLRSLIDWHKRRLVLRLTMGVALIALLAPATGWYVRTQREIKASDISARMTLRPVVSEGVTPEFLRLFESDAKLSLFAVERSQAEDDSTAWPVSTKERLGGRASLRLASEIQERADKSYPTVDGTSFEAVRVFSRFAGNMGSFSSPSAWEDCTFDARLEAIRSAPILSDPTYDEKDLQHTFEEHYGLTQADKDRWWDDYSAVPLPVQAVIELVLNGEVIGTCEGWVVRVREHDEDVRGLHVVYFKPFAVRR